MAILVDTGAFYALADKSDTLHLRARNFYSGHYAEGKFVTTDYILIETWILLKYRLGRKAAMLFWKNLMSGMIPVFGVQRVDLIKALSISQDFKDQDYSIIDCTTFALMNRTGIVDVFAFDEHFRSYRYGIGRKGYFNVLP